MKQRLFILLLALLCGMCLAAQAEDAAAEVPEGLVYKVYSTYVSITDYTGTATELVIPDTIEGLPVTKIGEYAFQNCDSLTSISIPNGVASIGNHAFQDCTSLTSITIPDSVTSIGDHAFSECTSLTTISIPDSVTSIGSYAFNNCTNLTSITIPDSVTSIRNSAFYGCGSLDTVYAESLEGWLGITFNGVESSPMYYGADLYIANNLATHITISDNVTAIRNCAFAGCTSLTSITIPDGVTSIGNAAFYNCTSLSSITLLDGVTSIGNSAFYGCSSLTSIAIPDSVTSIGDYVFYGCTSLTSITIPDSVTSIGMQAFYGCDSLYTVYAESLEGWLGIVFDDPGSSPMCNGADLYIANNLATHITIPEGVTSIGDYAFYRCTSLASITLPDGLTSIGNFAFRNCTSLSSITIPEGVTGIGNATFYGCSSLSSITLPDGVTSIGDSAFYGCTSLTSISIPDSVTSIGASAFQSCSSLTSITIPDSVTSIGNYAFRYCTNLKKVCFLGIDMPTIGTNAFTSSPTIYCYEYSDADYWAAKQGYACVYLDSDAGNEVTSCSLPADCYLLIGQSLTPELQIFPPTATCTPVWTSTAPEIVSVVDGTVTALTSGKATITVTCGDVSDSMEITAYAADEVAFCQLPQDCSLEYGHTLTLSLYTFPSTATCTPVWTSSAPEIVSVVDGTVTALAVGEATITVTCGNASDSMVITTFAYPEDFTLSASEMWVIAKTTAQLSIATTTPTGAKATFTYAIDDTDIATISTTGLITGVRPGDTVITVTSDNGLTRTCTLHVCYPVTAIAFDPAEATVYSGFTLQLTANVTARTQSFVNRLVTFSSSDETIATVDENGLLSALKPGTVTITATADSGVTGTMEVVVEDIAARRLPDSLVVIEGETFANTRLTSIAVPSGCTTISSRAFADNTALRIVVIPATVTSIAADAFEGCSDELTIVGPAGSYAQTYAESNGISFVAQ